MVVKRNKKWIETAQELFRIEQTLKELRAVYTTTKDTLKKLSNNEDTRGGNLMFFKEYRKGAINYRAIPVIKSMNPDDLEAYRGNQATTWKIKAI